MNCRSISKPRRPLIDRDAFIFAFCFVGKLFISPADEAMTGLIVLPKGIMRPLKPLHVPERNGEPQKQLMPGGRWWSTEPFVLLDLNVPRQKERRNSKSLLGAKRDGLAPILNLFRPIRCVWRIQFFAGWGQFRDHEFSLHTMQNCRRFPMVRYLEMHKMSDIRMVV